MSSAIKILPNYTYDDYVHWEGRWELIDGVPHAMAPLPIPKHQMIGGNIFSEFRIQLRKCKKCKVYQPLDLLIADDIILQPDMLVVCGEIKKKFLDFPPVLVAEILSPSTALKDRHTKYSIYESQQIKYYLIISPETEEVEVYELSGGEKKAYELKQKGHNFQYHFSFDSCEATIEFGEIW